jgi:hypothetical protein
MAAIAHPNLTGVAPHPRLQLCPPLRRRATTSCYRRRRAVVALVLVLACVALGLAAQQLQVRGATEPRATAGGAASAPTAAETVYVVQPGDTLWLIAAALHPDGDVRATVDHLVERNGTTALQVGQRLRVP